MLYSSMASTAAGLVIDAAGKAVCPGFINILSHSNLSILHDPRSLGELTQGVTTEVQHRQPDRTDISAARGSATEVWAVGTTLPGGAVS
jgi:cytosine/adenosine deaminase-related metal-dependent hydrolase